MIPIHIYLRFTLNFFHANRIIFFKTWSQFINISITKVFLQCNLKLSHRIDVWWNRMSHNLIAFIPWWGFIINWVAQKQNNLQDLMQFTTFCFWSLSLHKYLETLKLESRGYATSSDYRYLRTSQLEDGIRKNCQSHCPLI